MLLYLESLSYHHLWQTKNDLSVSREEGPILGFYFIYGSLRLDDPIAFMNHYNKISQGEKEKKVGIESSLL